MSSSHILFGALKRENSFSMPSGWRTGSIDPTKWTRSRALRSCKRVLRRSIPLNWRLEDRFTLHCKHGAAHPPPSGKGSRVFRHAAQWVELLDLNTLSSALFVGSASPRQPWIHLCVRTKARAATLARAATANTWRQNGVDCLEGETCLPNRLRSGPSRSGRGSAQGAG